MRGNPSSWLGDLRAKARRRFDSLDWPTPEDEEWRRTDLGRFKLSAFIPRESGDSVPARGRSGSAAGFARFEAGSCVELALADEWRERGVRLLSLEDLPEGGQGALPELLFEALDSAVDRVALWHFAELYHGVFLYVPPGLQIEEPFRVEFEERGSGLFEAPQVAVILDEGARASLILRVAESHPSSLLCDARTDILLGAASSLQLFDSQALGLDSLHFHQVRARLGKDSSLSRVEVKLGASLAKTRIDCSLEGRGAVAQLDGLYYCGPGQHADVGTIQRHVSAGATSRAYYKGAASGGGRAVFQGLIDVGEGATGTDAYLSNRNLLLGDAARADSIPTLKIGNNDVKCSHGSATGRLGEEELFYLHSRGFSEAEARELLVLGFFEEVLVRAPEGFREEALAGIRRRLPEAV